MKVISIPVHVGIPSRDTRWWPWRARCIAVPIELPYGINGAEDVWLAHQGENCSVFFASRGRGGEGLARLEFFRCVAYRIRHGNCLPYPVFSFIRDASCSTLFLIQGSRWLGRVLNAAGVAAEPADQPPQTYFHHFVVLGQSNYAEVVAGAFRIGRLEPDYPADGQEHIWRWEWWPA